MRNRLPTPPPLLRRAVALLRPRSIRGRVTALVALLAVLLLVPSGVLAGMLARQQLTNAGWMDARHAAALVAAEARAGRLESPLLTSSVPGVDLVQIVGPDRRVVASSFKAEGLAPLATVVPSAKDRQQDVQNCSILGLGCLRIAAYRVSSSPDSDIVYAGGQAPRTISPSAFDALFAVQVVVLVSLAVWAAWQVTGRTLRPVDAIRAELAATNVNDLSSRVPEPPGDDEVARLARTVNSTLERLENAKERMERVLAQQRQFASDASHELRTPIAGLRAKLEEARMYPEEIDQDVLLDRTLADVDRLQNIITDLLLLARLDGGAPTKLKKVDLAEAARAEVSRRIDRLPVRLHLAPGVVVNAVETQITRVLTNLLDNAQRHAKSTVLVEVRRDGDAAELIVSDDGDGIAEADRERIFERFTRLDASRCRDRGGTGLGLAIVRDIAHAHRGTIGVGSSEWGGARFSLRLPLADDAAEESPAPRGRLALASFSAR
ncbi:sensor histidine kinase [Sphaerisporangium fuscum]|uniref:sensor histidine kinase n=1 Tax=Sphaerisporangium fuscum TaxID=2835868 RepID=UPI001BDBC991|nr:HAMP domain-containing sensor histidine kinase [Sphaerisporangium fuscum]